MSESLIRNVGAEELFLALSPHGAPLALEADGSGRAPESQDVAAGVSGLLGFPGIKQEVTLVGVWSPAMKRLETYRLKVEIIERGCWKRLLLLPFP